MSLTLRGLCVLLLLIGGLASNALAETVVVLAHPKATVRVRNLATGATEVLRANRSGELHLDRPGAYRIEVPGASLTCFVFVSAIATGSRSVDPFHERAKAVRWWSNSMWRGPLQSEVVHRAAQPYSQNPWHTLTDQQQLDSARATKARVLETMKAVLAVGSDADADELIHFLNVLEVTEQTYERKIGRGQQQQQQQQESAATGPGERDLGGDWMPADGNDRVRIVQRGDRIEATILEPGESRKRGFAPGDPAFSGRLGADGLLTGEIIIRYPVEYRERCPAQWSRSVPMRAELSAGADRLSIPYPESKLGESCEISPGETTATWVLVRAPEPEPQTLRFRREGTGHAIAKGEPLPYDEPLRLEVTYAGAPAQAAAVVRLSWPGAPEVTLLVNRSSEDPTLFRSDRVTLRQRLDCDGQAFCAGVSTDWG